MSKPLKIFITYAHKNTKAKDELVTCLAIMKREGLISIWHDNEITAGDTWRDAIFRNLDDSDILLYLVSAYSLDSENCNKELAAALNANIRVIPVILESCDWLNHQLSDFQALPDKGKPITEWEHENRGWQNVVDGLRKTINKMQNQTHQLSGISEAEILAELACQRGNVLTMLGQTDMAVGSYSQATTLNPRHAAAYNNRGVIYGENDESDLAIKDFTKAIKIKSDYDLAYNNRGAAYRGKDKNDRAIKDCSKAICLNPDYAEPYNNRGTAYRNKGEVDLAIEDYDRAIHLKPNFAKAYYNRGIAYYEKGEFDLAIKDYSEAIELNPRLFHPYNNRGNAYLRKGDFDKAIEDYSKAIELNPNLGLAYCNRGEAWLHLKEWDKARSDLTVAKSMQIDIVEAFHNTYRDISTFERRNDVKLPKDIVAMLMQYPINPFTTTQKVVTHDGEIRESAAVLELLEKFRNAGKPLHEHLQEHSSRGITTGYNEAFIVGRATRDALIAEHPSSADVLKPFLMARDIQRWRVKPTDESRREAQDKWLIFAHREIDINAYPVIKKYLGKYRDALKKRSGKQEWYELQTAPTDTVRFTQPKCIYADMASETAFAFDDEGYYVGSPASLLSTSDLWLLGVLNTRTVSWFYARTAPQVRGPFLKFVPRYVSQIPIPDMESEQRALIHKIVEYILYLKKQPTVNSRDLKYARDSVMLGYFERIIDGMVYESYLPDELHKGRKHFFQPLLNEQLPPLEEIRGDKMSALRDIFERLYEKTHPVAVDLFFLSSVQSVRIIESKA